MSFGLVADYLGWKPSAGVYGRQFCDPVVQELMDKRRVQGVRFKRHSLEFVNKKKLKLAELPADSRLHKPLRYPSIPISDITYVQQEDGRTDPLVFCLILLGYNEESSYSVHVHVWRGRSLEATSEFVARLNKCLTTRDHLQLVRQRECELLATREVQPSGLFATEPSRSRAQQPASSAGGAAAPGAAVAAAAASKLPAELQSVTEELKRKLRDFGADNGASGAGGVSGGAVPLLHPPRDYDTASRSHGNAMLARTEAQLRTGSRAPTGAVIRRTPPPPPPPPPPPQAPTAQMSQLSAPAVGSLSSAVNSGGSQIDNNNSDSSECDCEDVERAAAADYGNGSEEAWADPGRGFLTWRRRRMQQRRQRLAGVSGHAGGSSSIVGWDGFEPLPQQTPPPLPTPPSVEQWRQQQQQQQQQRHKGSSVSSGSDRPYQPDQWL